VARAARRRAIIWALQGVGELLFQLSNAFGEGGGVA